MKPDPTKNNMKTAPFADRLATWTWRGFLAGMVVSYTDIVFVTQSVNLRTNIARILYLTPPVMTVPMSYVTTREVLEHTVGDKLWTYGVAAFPGAAIWGVFRKSVRAGATAFAFMAGFGGLAKANSDLGGQLWNTNGTLAFWDRDRPLHYWNLRTGTDRFDKIDPGPYWKQFVDEKQDPAKDTKV